MRCSGIESLIPIVDVCLVCTNFLWLIVLEAPEHGGSMAEKPVTAVRSEYFMGVF